MLAPIRYSSHSLEPHACGIGRKNSKSLQPVCTKASSVTPHRKVRPRHVVPSFRLIPQPIVLDRQCPITTGRVHVIPEGHSSIPGQRRSTRTLEVEDTVWSHPVCIHIVGALLGRTGSGNMITPSVTPAWSTALLPRPHGACR